jgi:transglutaminase-like putative cysteine protease
LPQIPAKEFHYTVTSRVDDVSLREDPATFNQVRRPTRDQPVGQTSAPIERIREFGERVVASLGTAGATERPLPRPGAEEPDTDNRSRGSGGGAFIERFRQPTYYAAKCLQLPATIDREAIAELSREVAANATTPFEQCRAIESYLRTNYEYSLEQKRPTEGNFVSNFLFRTKKGHCEYFATSMVMMLRVLGIPSRIVNGYYCAEWNNIGNLFTVRQRDAHSWVEAHFDNYGWMTFDPTPPTGVGRLPDTNPILLAIGRSFDAMKIRWYRYMIDFNLRDQLVIARGFLNLTRWLGDSLGTFRVSWISDEVQASPRDVGSLFAAIAITAAGVAGAVALWRSRLVRWTRRVVRQKSLVRKIAPFYEEIVRLLERHGFIRSLTETPREFAARVSVDANLYQFAEITEVYYHHKYGGHGLAEHHLRAAREFAIHLRARK